MRATTTATSATREDGLRVGDEGVDVARLQQRLLDDGCERVGAVDGCVYTTEKSRARRVERVENLNLNRREKCWVTLDGVIE